MDWSPLRRCEIPAEYGVEGRHRSGLFAPAEPFRVVACGVDHEALSEADRRLFDDGDLLPGWTKWWLDLAAHLRAGESRGLYSQIITRDVRSAVPRPLSPWSSRVRSHLVYPLMVNDWCSEIASSSWAACEGMRAIVRDAAAGDGNGGTRLPIACRGGVMPMVEGLGA